MNDLPDYASLGLSQDAIETFETLDQAPSIEHALHKLAGHDVSKLGPDDPLPGMSNSKEKGAAARIHRAFAEVNTFIAKSSKEQMSVEQWGAVEHIRAKDQDPSTTIGKSRTKATMILTKQKASSKTSRFLGKKSKAPDKLQTQVVFSHAAQSLARVGEHHGRIADGDFLKAQVHVTDPKGKKLAANVIAALSISTMPAPGKATYQQAAAMTPIPLGGTASQTLMVMGLSDVPEDAQVPSEIQAKAQEPGNAATIVPLAIVKGQDGGMKTRESEYDHDLGISSFGLREGQEVSNEHMAYHLQQEVGIPAGVPCTQALVLHHSALEGAGAALEQLSSDYNVSVNQREVMEIMAEMETDGNVSLGEFQNRFEDLVMDKAVPVLQKAFGFAPPLVQNDGSPCPPLTPAMLKDALAKSNTDDQLVSQLAEHLGIDKDSASFGHLKTKLFGMTMMGANGPVQVAPPGGQGVEKLFPMFAPTAAERQVRAQLGTRTALTEIATGVYAGATHPSRPSEGEWSSMQAFQEGGTLFHELDEGEMTKVTSTAIGRTAMLDGMTMQRDRFGQNMLTVVRTQQDVVGDIRAQDDKLPGLGDHVEAQLAQLQVPDGFNDMTPYEQQDYINGAADEILGAWVEPDDMDWSKHLDVEADVHNLVEAQVAAINDQRQNIQNLVGMIKAKHAEYPGLGDRVEQQLANLHIPDDFNDMTLEGQQQIIENATAAIVDGWAVPSDFNWAEHIDVQEVINQAVEAKVSTPEGSFRDLVAIDNAMSRGDPTIEVEHQPGMNILNPQIAANNQWVGEPGARTGRFPTHTREHLANFDFKGYVAKAKAEDKKLQKAAGAQFESQTSVSENQYKMQYLGMLVVKQAAKENRTFFDMGVFKDRPDIKGPDGNVFAGTEPFMKRLWDKYGDAENVDAMDEAAILADIQNMYAEIDGITGGAADGYRKINQDQRKRIIED